MPPKAKYTQAEIVKAGLELVRREGGAALTARALGEQLGSSARPIFTVFQSMDEVRQAVLQSARQCYDGYVERGLAQDKAFRGVGAQYIQFAICEPRLFHLLFMSESERPPDLSTVLPSIDDNYHKILQSIEKDYGIHGPAAERLYQHLWIYCHGIATLCAAKVCQFTGEQIQQMITEIFLSLIAQGGENHD